MAPDAATSKKKLYDLRAEMLKAQVSAYVVPSSDPHLLEYAPDQFKRRAFISGFAGSTGTAVITEEKAALWTDGRYFLQAEQELSDDWVLMKSGTPDCPKITKWLCTTLEAGSKVGIDPFCHSEREAETMVTELKENKLELVGIYQNLVDVVWGDDIPKDPMHPIFVHPVEIAGESAESKLTRIREEMKKVDASVLMISKVEEIGWTLNLRGGDEAYSPIFIAYLLITAESAELFIASGKVTKEVQTYLSDLGVAVKPYDQVTEGLKEQLTKNKDTKVWLDPGLVNHSMFLSAKETLGAESGERIVSKGTPWTRFMALKNEKELDGMRQAHLRDATAVINFLSWLEKEIGSGKSLTEVDIDKEITARRSVQEGFRSCSFPTIAGANGNGAIIHYSASEESCGTVDGNTMLLIDSGGQYDCGTTDLTRTFHLGTPTDYQRTCFTKVLQGHIAMATAVFPDGTPGIAIDAFARRPLWSLGLEYLHGTGHGVGAYMCVHEGPISVSNRCTSALAQEPLKENMIISNEPGYYESGKFGIRIESLCVIKKKETPFAFDGRPFLGFETISLVPIQKKLLKTEEMTKDEISWINTYHKDVWEKLSDRVSPEAKEWLKHSTSPL